MVKVIVSLCLGVGFIQILNYIFIKHGSDVNILKNNFYLVLITMPIQILSSLAFVYFYSQGVKNGLPYVYLSLISFAASLFVALLVSVFIFKITIPTPLDVIAIILTILGISLFLYQKSMP